MKMETMSRVGPGQTSAPTAARLARTPTVIASARHPPLMTDAPLPEALSELLERKGLALPRLASLLRAEGLTIGRTRLDQLSRGDGPPPTPDQMERLASVLGVSPGHFAEYRLWRARSLLDPGVVGFDRAMANFARFRGGRTGAVAEGGARRAGEARG